MGATVFGARLKELRMENGLTQKQLAEKASVSQNTVSTLEQGVYEPVWSTVIALAQALGVDCRAFLDEPAERPDVGRGRPRKGPAPERASKPKRTRRRSQKDEAGPAAGEDEH